MRTGITSGSGVWSNFGRWEGRRRRPGGAWPEGV